MDPTVPQWLAWAREIQALAQSGLTYAANEYDHQRYARLAEIAAEMAATQVEMDEATILASYQAQLGYATPKVDMRAGVIREGKILLVQEQSDGRWSMPGGWADVGEVPSSAAAREVWEESGFEVKVEKLVAVYDANRFGPLELFHAYKIIFLCSLTGGKAAPSFETPAVDFFDLGDLPPLSEHRTTRFMIEEVFAHHADPSRPAHFD